MFFRMLILAFVAVAAGFAGDLPTAAVSAAPLVAGDILSDAQFLDSRGRAWRWSDFRGRPLAFTFIFTRCPLPEFCPRMLSHFAAVERALEAAPIPGGWHLVCLTLDPAFDTPAVLAAYAEGQHPDPAHWIFATGEVETIGRLGAGLGLAVARIGEIPTHTLRTVVVDAEGRIRKIFAGGEWTPAELEKEMRSAAGRR
jgi:protein SCO1/2